MKCPDCGEILVRINDTLYQCPITGLYYPCKYGKLGYPLAEPPANMRKPPPPPPKKPSKQTRIPKQLYMELVNKIGEEQIPSFLAYLENELKMQPFQFMVQPKRLKNDVITRAFPNWLEKQGLA